jgi:hypothetical protein
LIVAYLMVQRNEPGAKPTEAQASADSAKSSETANPMVPAAALLSGGKPLAGGSSMTHSAVLSQVDTCTTTNPAPQGVLGNSKEEPTPTGTHKQQRIVRRAQTAQV